MDKFNWHPFLLLFFGYVFYSWNRKSVSLVMPTLIEEGLSSEVAGSINSAQNLAYAISKFIGGILSDRVNPSYLLSFGLVFGGVTTIAFSFADSSWLFILIWFANGLAQGFGWPACAKILKLSYTKSQFALLWSYLSCSANLSIALNSVLSAYILLNYGWKLSIIFAGTVSIAMGGFSYVLLRNEQSFKNKSENNGKSSVTQHSSKKVPNDDEKLLKFLLQPLMMFLLFTNFVLMLVKNALSDWAPLYLIQEIGQTAVLASFFTGSLEIGGIVGTILSGYASEFVMKPSKKSKLVYNETRRLLAVIGFMIGLCIVLVLFCLLSESSSKIYLMILGFVIGGAIYGPINIAGMVSSQTVPQHLSGTLHAFFSLAGNIGGIVAGLPIATFSQIFNWKSSFLLMNLFCMVDTLILILSYRLWNIFTSKS